MSLVTHKTSAWHLLDLSSKGNFIQAEKMKGDTMAVLPDIVDMLKSGVHFGHKKSRRHPKMEPYIFTVRNDVHVIDLDKTLLQLDAALEFVKGIAKRGGTILFVGTKKQAQQVVEQAAVACNMPYVRNRWIGGTVTNFAVISKLIKKFKKLKEKMESGELATKYTKKEQLDFSREIDEFQKNLGGIQDLNKLPDAMILVDLIAESTALREARKRHIPIVALCDTNVNPELVDYPVPCNDDAIKAIAMMMNAFSAAIQEGSKNRVVEKEKEIGAGPTQSKIQNTKASALQADEHHAAVNL